MKGAGDSSQSSAPLFFATVFSTALLLFLQLFTNPLMGLIRMHIVLLDLFRFGLVLLLLCIVGVVCHCLLSFLKILVTEQKQANR